MKPDNWTQIEWRGVAPSRERELKLFLRTNDIYCYVAPSRERELKLSLDLLSLVLFRRSLTGA